MSRLYCVTRIIDGVVNYLHADGVFKEDECEYVPADLKDRVLDAVEAGVGTLYVSQEVSDSSGGWALPIQIDRLIAAQCDQRIELDIVHAMDDYPSVGNKALFVRFDDDSNLGFNSGWVNLHLTSPYLHKARVLPIDSIEDLNKVKERFSALDNGVTLDVLVIYKGYKG